jgi:hypothetical protein
MSIEQRVRDLRRQERADEELALRPVRALYAPCWTSIREACGAMAGGHEWRVDTYTIGGDPIMRCARCLASEVRR